MVVKKLQARVASDPQFKDSIAQYKVLLGEKDGTGNVVLEEKTDRHGERVPSLVIYAESKEEAQLILDTVCELFPEEENLGSDQIPRYNKKIDSLIFYAQGSAVIKANLPEELLEVDMAHFKEDFSGQHQLENPRE